MIAISSQNYRNIYEKLYDQIRNYLWPYKVLEVLADVETDVYNAFIDTDKLRIDFEKLKKAMKDVLIDDPLLQKYVTKMTDLLNEPVETTVFLGIPRVNESNPENFKIIKTLFDDEAEEAKVIEQTLEDNKRRQQKDV